MKKCFIVTRYFVKRTRTVCCIVRNDQGKQYTTCLHANGRTSCTCKAGEAGQKCYHVKHLIKVEQSRQVASPAQNRAETGKSTLSTARPVVGTTALPKASTLDLGTRGTLTRSASAQAATFLMLPSRQALRA